jgi:para-aminobenzoate synthetase component 1
MLSTKDPLNLESLFSLFHDHHPAPAAGYWRCEKWEIASASPETFFRVDVRDRKRRITTSPIKGTSKDRNFAKKDSAENVMIVDLMRNDISPLCEPSSVVVPRLLDVEEHPGLFHLVSDVSGQLKTDITWSQLLKRMTPAGSISGAPKSSALEVIKRFEKYRGPYCGTLGWIQNGKAHFSVLIRTFFKDFNVDPEVTYFGTGAGITWGSEPVAEWQETVLKAERLMEIADRT